jgi:hypothetical protein
MLPGLCLLWARASSSFIYTSVISFVLCYESISKVDPDSSITSPPSTRFLRSILSLAVLNLLSYSLRLLISWYLLLRKSKTSLPSGWCYPLCWMLGLLSLKSKELKSFRFGSNSKGLILDWN